jgi:hypothetical protein
MAKNGTKAPITELTREETISEEMLQQMHEDSGLGVSQDPRDKVLPLVRLMQGLSPQVDRRGPDYVTGAEPGDFWFKNARTEIVKGDVGFIFWPIGAQRAYVEWKPNRGGFVNTHIDMPAGSNLKVEIDRETGKEKRILKLPNGNDLVETVYLGGIAENDLWVITFASTGLAVYRQFNDQLSKFKRVIDGKMFIDPIWKHKWRWTSVQQTNAESQRWFQWKYAHHEEVLDMAVYKEGKMFFENFKKEVTPRVLLTVQAQVIEETKYSQLPGGSAPGATHDDDAPPF